MSAEVTALLVGDRVTRRLRHRQPVVLDLFCGAGGVAMGYAQAGFRVIGVDVKPQPSFPFEFIQDEARAFLRRLGDKKLLNDLPKFDLIHASPPCQRWSVGTRQWSGRWDGHPDLITPLRPILRKLRIIYVIENVRGSPLKDPITLCGSSFYLPIRRHRLFESNVSLESPSCHHERYRAIWPPTRSDHGPGKIVSNVGHAPNRGVSAGHLYLNRHAMGTWWMENRDIIEAVPPDYTAYIGRQIWQHLYEKGRLYE